MLISAGEKSIYMYMSTYPLEICIYIYIYKYVLHTAYYIYIYILHTACVSYRGGNHRTHRAPGQNTLAEATATNTGEAMQQTCSMY